MVAVAVATGLVHRFIVAAMVYVVARVYVAGGPTQCTIMKWISVAAACAPADADAQLNAALMEAHLAPDSSAVFVNQLPDVLM